MLMRMDAPGWPVTDGDRNPATRHTVKPKPTAVCLKKWKLEFIFRYLHCTCTISIYFAYTDFCAPDRSRKQLLNVDHTY